MDVQQRASTGGRVLPRLPDTTAETSKAGQQLNRFHGTPSNGGFSLRALIAQLLPLIQNLLQNFTNPNPQQPPPPQAQPVYGAPVDTNPGKPPVPTPQPPPQAQPVYGAPVDTNPVKPPPSEPKPPQFQPVYGAPVDTNPIKPPPSEPKPSSR